MRRAAIVAGVLLLVAFGVTVYPTPYSYNVMRRGSVDHYTRVPRWGSGPMEYRQPDGTWSTRVPGGARPLPIDAPRDQRGLDPDIAKILASPSTNR